jgi:hypothetical protein
LHYFTISPLEALDVKADVDQKKSKVWQDIECTLLLYNQVLSSWAICRSVLTSGGVQKIIWEVHSGLNVPQVVLSVRGCFV